MHKSLMRTQLMSRSSHRRCLWWRWKVLQLFSSAESLVSSWLIISLQDQMWLLQPATSTNKIQLVLWNWPNFPLTSWIIYLHAPQMWLAPRVLIKDQWHENKLKIITCWNPLCERNWSSFLMEDVWTRQRLAHFTHLYNMMTPQGSWIALDFRSEVL